MYLVKNFRKFLKFKNNGKFVEKGKFPNFGKEKKDLRRKMGRILNPLKESRVTNVIVMDFSRKSVPTI